MLFFIFIPVVVSGFTEPFKVGERLEYRVSLGLIPAGWSVMEVVEIVKINGLQAYHFHSKVTSNKVIASVYNLNDRINSYVSTDDFRTLKYVAMTRENDRERTEFAVFDYKEGKAVYKKNEKEKTFTIPTDLHDSLSSFYYLRRLNLKTGKKFVIRSFSGGRLYENTIQVVGREKITVNAGTFKALKVFIHAEAIEEKAKKGESYVWFTDDERKVPVKIKTKSDYGYIVSDLERIVIPDE